MDRVYENESCPLHGSEYCALLNMESCDKCTVKSRNESDAEGIKLDLDAMRALMPEEGISELFAGEECMLCKGEKKGKREFYALTDLGNDEPKHAKPEFLGVKLKSRTGSVLPIQISCCAECRKRFLRIEYLPALIGTVGAAVMLILMSIRPIREPIASASAMLPFILFIGVTAAAVVTGYVLRASMVKKYAELTHLDIMEIGALSRMKKLGWYELAEKKGCSKLIFSKERLKQGVFTGENGKNEKKPENVD